MNDIRENLKAYLDGELSPEMAARVATALEQDEALRQEVQDMSRISFAFRHYDQAASQAPNEPAKKPESRRPWWRVKWAPMAAVGALVVIVAGSVVMSRPETFPKVSSAAGAAAAVDEATAGAPTITPSMPGEAARPAAQIPESAANSEAGEYESQGIYPQDSPAAPAKSESRGRESVPNSAAAMASKRDVIRRAVLGLLVKSVQDSQTAIESLTTGWGGFIESADLNRQVETRVTASMVLRIPSNRFDVAMSALREIGEVQSENVSGEDVTGQRVDLEARLKTMRAEVESLRQILRQARRVGEVLEIRDRITQTQSEIESLTAQLAVLKDQSAYSTVSLTLTQRPSGSDVTLDKGNWSGDAFASAMENMRRFGRGLGEFLIHVLIYGPVWLPIALITVVILRRNASKS